VDAVQIVGGAYFAGGVAEDGEFGVGAAHSHPVVGDADEADAAVDYGHLDIFAVSVDCVLDQFLDNRGGAFDDLAGGDFVGRVRVKDADDRLGHDLPASCLA
jgi:hypothetical protein